MKSKHFGATILALFAALLCVFVSSCKGETSSYYTITYETEHGTAPDAKKVLSGTVLTADDLPELTEDGFTFEGWYIGSSQITSELGYTVNSNIKLTAKWTENAVTPAPVYYTIAYVTEHGQAPQSKQVLSGTKLTATDLPELSEQGFIFDGWYIGETKITADYEVLSNITLTAKWLEDVVLCTITYVTAYGQAPQNKQVPVETILTATYLPVINAEGYTFNGWYIGNIQITAGYKITSDITLSAWWGTEPPPPVSFTVSYQSDYDSASVPGPKTVSSENPLTALELPDLSYEGYEFGGWYLNGVKIEAGYHVLSDITLVAKWTPIYYTITYQTVYDTEHLPIPTEVLHAKTLTADYLPDLSYTGYDFDGWYIGQIKITAGYQVMDNITLTAKWTAVYTITYSTAQGTAPAPKTFRTGTSLSAEDLAAPSYTGTDYEFDGWYNGNTKILAGTTVTSSMTLEAKWTPYYTVSYITTFGTAPSTKRVPEGTNLTDTDLPDNYTEQGYTFGGWYLDTEKITAGYEVVSNITLMAKWLKNYTVSYSSERGSLPVSKTVPDKTVLGSNDLQPLTADGYTFDGWYAGNTKITSSYQVTGDVTLIGKWNYTITYSTDHGTAPSNKTVVSGYALTQTDLQTLSDSDGYRFTGWKIGSQAAVVNYSVVDNITLTAQWIEIPSGVSLFVEAASGVTQDELNFAVTAEKSGDNYILTATPGCDVYLWSVDIINIYDEDYFYYNVDELDGENLYYGNIPTEITSNTLTFNEDTLPSAVPKDGTYVVYVQAFKKKKISPSGMPDAYIYEHVGIVFTVIRM